MIRDRLLFGVRNTKIQQCLLAKTELSFEGALKIVCAMERAEKNMHDTEEGVSKAGKIEGLVNKLQGRQREIYEKAYKKGQECFWCDGNHFRTQCRFKNVICHNCDIVGPFTQKCLKSKKMDVKKHLQNSTQLLEEETVANKNEDFDDLYIY